MGGEKKKAARPLLTCKIRREISEPSDDFRFFLVFGQRGMQQVGEHGSEIARDIIGLHEALPADILEQGVLLRLHLHSLVRYSCSAFCRWFFFTVGGGRCSLLVAKFFFECVFLGVVVWWRGGGGAGRGRTDLPSHNTRKKEIRASGGAGSPAAALGAMTLRFVLMVNKQGQTRLAQYYERLPMDERCALEAEVIRKCLARTETQCSFFEYRGYKVVYRRYASLFFIVGVEGDDENELSILEFIHALVETLDRYFENVCELDIMFNLEKAHFILDEMVMNGCIIETNKNNILSPVMLLDKTGSL